MPRIHVTNRDGSERELDRFVLVGIEARRWRFGVPLREVIDARFGNFAGVDRARTRIHRHVRRALSQRRQGRPFLGICVGMQLLAREGHEHGVHRGLGWIAGEVVRLAPADPVLKVPQTGWNELSLTRPEHPLLAGIAHGDHAYFVHSYHLRPRDPGVLLAATDYGGPVLAALGSGTIAGTGFTVSLLIATLAFRGDVLIYVRIGEDGLIERCHMRDASWFQWPLLEVAIEGNIVADFPLCNKSFNCSYSGHDL